MNVIYKYRIGVTHVTTLTLPPNAKVLHVDLQCDNPTLWVEVDKDVDASESRRFVALMTGQTVDEGMRYISTVILGASGIVAHYYEIT